MEDLSSSELILKLQEQLSVARKEISNLRQQVKTLSYVNQKEIKKIEDVLSTWKCKKCSQDKKGNVEEHAEKSIEKQSNSEDISFQPIGTINTEFNKKRGVPRQPGIGCRIHGKITLNNIVFTNPEHALDGLQEYSHMWILFHFHRNGSNHIKAKVSPPRLNGIRTGVFSTRSPHRPCAIGLSLVQISYIDGPSIYFSGVDMLDGTPVLDLKPYIPLYDNPSNLMKFISSGEIEAENDSASLGAALPIVLSENGRHNNLKDFGEREAPDGEESGEQVTPLPTSTSSDASYQIVRVPKWISDPPVPQLNVSFCKNIEEHLEHNTKEIIKSILREDPRSIYLRERYGNQFYTFLIHELHVSCKFDDTLQSVNVYRVAPAEKLCSCGIPEWQCTQHQTE